MPANAQPQEQVIFPAHVSPIGIFFVVVPVLIMIFGALSLSMMRLPIVLMILLLVVMGSCAVLLKSAVEEMGQVVIDWSGQGITVKTLLASTSYYWSHIERVELYDPGATFGDKGRHEELRMAIGLYLRDPERKQRDESEPPDVMLVSRTDGSADKIPKLVERLSNAKRYGGGKDARKLGAAGSANGGRAARSFRKQANAPAA